MGQLRLFEDFACFASGAATITSRGAFIRLQYCVVRGQGIRKTPSNRRALFCVADGRLQQRWEFQRSKTLVQRKPCVDGAGRGEYGQWSAFGNRRRPLGLVELVRGKSGWPAGAVVAYQLPLRGFVVDDESIAAQSG